MARPSKRNERNLISRIAGGASEKVLNVVDPNQVLDHVDVDSLMDRIDVDGLLDRVDVNNLLDRVDVNGLLDRVEPDQLLDRVDVNRLLDRVDVDALLARANIDAIMDRVDVQALVDRAGIPDIVAESTSHLTGSALDLARRPLVGLDEIMVRTIGRLLRRDPNSVPDGPSRLVDWVDDKAGERRGVKTGRYAGPLTRLLAVALDFLVVTASFTMMVGLVDFFAARLSGNPEISLVDGVVYGILLGVWGFLYVWIGTAVAGKTPGKAVLGLRVVTADGDPALHRREPLIRVLTMPLSYLVFGLGLIGILVDRERRAWHDRFARTAVVYDWGSRTATLPTPLATFLERREADPAVAAVESPADLVGDGEEE